MISYNMISIPAPRQCYPEQPVYNTAVVYFLQVLGQIYGILSNKERRALYDEDGTIDEDDDAVFTRVRTPCVYCGSGV